MTPFGISRSLRRVQIFRFAFRIQNSSAKRDRFSLSVEHREHQPSTKTIVRTAFIFLDDESTFFKLLLRRAFLTEMSRKSFPTVGSKTEMKCLHRLFSDAALFQIFAYPARRRWFTLKL